MNYRWEPSAGVIGSCLILIIKSLGFSLNFCMQFKHMHALRFLFSGTNSKSSFGTSTLVHQHVAVLQPLQLFGASQSGHIALFIIFSVSFVLLMALTPAACGAKRGSRSAYRIE